MPPVMRLAGYLAACLALLAGPANGFWRLPCRGKAGVARLDPMLNPGGLSYHAHTVQGSGNFAMTVTQESLRQANCTSCAVSQDKSSYWAPVLYFIHANGSAELVQQAGGMLVYYLLYGENVTAFPNNFRMLAGDTFQRNFSLPIPDPPKSDWKGDQLTQSSLRQKAIGFNCLNYHADAEPSLYRHYLPNKAFLDAHCKDGLRFEIMFPSCWNGKDVDSPDHKSHMAYPNLVMTGQCPPGFETRLVSLFYETIYDTPAFEGQEGQFVISNGDPTGFGYHADFIQGWDPEFLQQAIHTCTSDSGEVTECPLFDLQSNEEQAQCKFSVPEPLLSENVNLHSTGLPGNIAIQSGPAYASPIMYASLPTNPASSTGSLLSSGTSTTPSGTSLSQSTSTTPPETSTTSTSTISTTSTSTSTSPEPMYTTVALSEEIVYVEQAVIVTVDGKGDTIGTGTSDLKTLATSTTVTEAVSTIMPTSATGLSQHPRHVHRNTGHHGHIHGVAS